MTVIVGIRCADGAVLASDSDATFGTSSGLRTIGQQPAQKVKVLNEKLLFATSGAIGLSQSVEQSVKELSRTDKMAKNISSHIQVKDLIANTIRGTLAPSFQGAGNSVTAGFPQGAATQTVTCETIIAAPVMGKAHVFHFDFHGQGEACSEQLPFISYGSGQYLADPFLAYLRRIFWPDRLPSLGEGTFAAAWTIHHVCRTNPGGVGGSPQIATIETGDKGKLQARIHEEQDIAEHMQNVEAAEEHLREIPLSQEPTGAPVPPKPPEHT